MVEGKCPKCLHDLNYDGAFDQTYDQGGYYWVDCPSCEWAGREWHITSFSHYEDEVEEE